MVAKIYKIHYIEEETQIHKQKLFMISTEKNFIKYCLGHGIIEISRTEVGLDVYVFAPQDKKVDLI